VLKRVICIENPSWLSVQHNQLVIERRDLNTLSNSITIPIEDIGTLILENSQIGCSLPLLQKCIEFNVAVVVCDEKHMPSGLFLNLEGHTLQSQITKSQVEASIPLKKQLWMQTVKAKVKNQSAVLKSVGLNYEPLVYWASQVRSGDPDGIEGRAAAFYWKELFKNYFKGFLRDQNGLPPNNVLNYAYAIIRALIARSLVGSGLLPQLGIFHRNQYNAYCLADDIMEPYRPFADVLVYDMVSSGLDISELNKDIKQQVLKLLFSDVKLEGKKSPLQTAAGRTSASLAACFAGSRKSVLYPVLYDEGKLSGN
jgi:CRISPR-associated protein Cas1